MPQLHFYVSEGVAERIRDSARARSLSVSRFLSELVTRDMGAGWPDGFFEEVIGGWQGEPLVRPAQGAYEERDPLIDSSRRVEA